jgi:hypothetical protein
MQVSQFEIYRLVQRALEALGASYGSDRDAAFATAWLEARDLPGLALLASDLPDLERGIGRPRREGASDLEIDASGSSAITFAGAVVDFALARMVGPTPVRLLIRRCRSPLFLIPAAVENARGLAIDFVWRGRQCRVLARAVAGELTLFLPPGQEVRTALLEPTACDVDFHLASSGASLPPLGAGLATVLSPEGLARQLAHSLYHGIAVDPAIWRRLDALAARVQVPASEESRLRGAGGGDANA